MQCSSDKHERENRDAGFTLVELLVVIAIIGVLVALLLPAVQAAREAARRTQCVNHLKQIGLAVLNYESIHKSLPTGNLHVPSGGQGMTWSGYILPFVEQQTLYDRLGFGEHDQFAVPPPGAPGVYDSYATNVPACETFMNGWRCPSASIPQQMYYVSKSTQWLWVVFNRVPATYIGCASGVRIEQEADASQPATHSHLRRSDGVIFNGSYTRLKTITDGTTHTLLVGEALPENHEWRPGQAEPPGTKDHWYIGGDDLDTDLGNDMSEVVGSTGIPINTPKGQPGYELSFSSAHAGGANVVLCDGSVRYVAEEIDPQTWSNLGNRADGNVMLNDF
jgi:prepilin-type N-terminal cleavage/methylation domain-containing protein/prepilin-type processing-associated H-X9-DG protein